MCKVEGGRDLLLYLWCSRGCITCLSTSLIRAMAPSTCSATTVLSGIVMHACELRETLDHTRVGQRSCLVLRLRLTVRYIGLLRARSQVLQDVDLRLEKETSVLSWANEPVGNRYSAQDRQT
jgi:hypothetical protein